MIADRHVPFVSKKHAYHKRKDKQKDILAAGKLHQVDWVCTSLFEHRRDERRMHIRDLFFVLCSYLGRFHHQADACHMASVYLGFRSIWNTHFCLRLQPHLYPSLVGTSLGRDVRPNSDISQRMPSPTPPSETRNYCWIKVGDSQRWTHIDNPTRLNVIDPDWDYWLH